MPIKIWYLWSATKSAKSLGLIEGDLGGTKRDPTNAPPEKITHAMPDQAPNRSNLLSRLFGLAVTVFLPSDLSRHACRHHRHRRPLPRCHGAVDGEDLSVDIGGAVTA